MGALIAYTQLFRSKAFKGLLEKVLGDAPVVASRRQARRFRPGLDYTLATPGAPWAWKSGRPDSDGGSGEGNDGTDGKGGGEDEKDDGGKGGTAEKKEEELMVLDAVLCFVDDREPYKEAAWRQDEVGGYVTYLGGDEDDDDVENVNSSDGGSKDTGSSSTDRGGGTADSAAVGEGASSGGASGGADAQKNDAAVYKADEGGSLISVSAASNALSLVLRDDAGISSFVKYVSSAAPGSRFDVVGEYLVACTDDDDEEEDGADVVDSSSSEGSFGVPGGVLETVPEGESGEEEEEEDAEAETERSRKKLKTSNHVPA